ncbi:MAG: LruC domain-containing protein [Bacteroidales bacterium]|nr:LruC domain-containing protein [Bacteroidales bacterium]MCF8456862.1 LruC domain-containing protein [Bacteroidales bacterium]
MKKQISFFLFGLLLVSLVSCELQDVPTETGNDSFNSLVIPPNFDFKSTHEVDVQILVLDQITSMIEIYDGDPDQGGNLLKKGLTGSDFSYKTNLVLPATVNEIYAVRHSFDGSVRSESIPVSSSNLSYNFGYKNLKSGQTIGYLVSPGTWPDCNSSYDFDVPNNYSGNLNIPSGETWRIDAGNTYTGNLDFQSWGTNYLIVCGTATINSFGDGIGTIVVTSTGTLYVKDNFNPANASNLVNYGTVEFKSGSTWKTVTINGGMIENQGTMSANKIYMTTSDFLNLGSLTLADDLDVNSCDITNAGELNIGDKLLLNGSTNVFENYDAVSVANNSTVYGTINNYNGTMHFNNTLLIAGGASFYNGCKLWANGQLKVVGSLENAGYVLGEGELEINGGSTLTLDEGSLVSVNDLDLNGYIVGSTFSYAKIEVADNTDLAWGTSITGKIDLCDADGINVNNATIGSDVTYCLNEVMSTDCVPGNGISIFDQDNDGVPDSMDEYPTDINRAFNSYYPNANDFSSLAFEDLWPSMGDYDFNDLVVNLQYKTVTNASNQVVDLVGKFKIKAIGATLNNGFGFSFDALPASVSSVTGTQLLGTGISVASNGLEAGHTNKAVVIVCDKINTYAGASLLNTDASGTLVDIPLITVIINFGSPQASIGSEPFNPFIYVSQTRGREVHLINNAPTELVDPNWFGQDNDVSVPANSVYYKTINNYPFALETPVPLDYPTEKTDIVTAHLKFGTWAESSGNQYPDWYDNQPGYRNNNKIKINNINN